MSSLTNERLRSWLNANQASRERLCAGLLPVLGDYSEIRPRRPEGGPDGGRDLDAIYQRHIHAAIGIGFRNNVCDDEDDKTWVRTKALADAVNAKNKTNSTHFVFITNVDLTPSESTKLLKSISEVGFASCDVIYRERLRLALDSPEGFALRAMHLHIALDIAEQATFFAKFAEKINGNDSSEILNRLARLELGQEVNCVINEVSLKFRFRDKDWWQILAGKAMQVQLMSFTNSKEFFCRTANIIFRRPKKVNNSNFNLRWFAAHARISEISVDGKSHAVIGDASFLIDSPMTREFELYVPVFQMIAATNKAAMLKSLDRTRWSISMSHSVIPSVSEIFLIADSWILARLQPTDNQSISSKDCSFESDAGLWPSGIHLRERREKLGIYCSGFNVDFRRIVPERVWDNKGA